MIWEILNNCFPSHSLLEKHETMLLENDVQGNAHLGLTNQEKLEFLNELCQMTSDTNYNSLVLANCP